MSNFDRFSSSEDHIFNDFASYVEQIIDKFDSDIYYLNLTWFENIGGEFNEICNILHSNNVSEQDAIEIIKKIKNF